jgi:hypothetical protein
VRKRKRRQLDAHRPRQGRRPDRVLSGSHFGTR